MQSTEPKPLEVRGQKSEVKVTSFPSDDFLSRAVEGLQRLARQQHINSMPWPPAFDHLDLQRRHAPAMPQAPGFKPAT